MALALGGRGLLLRRTLVESRLAEVSEQLGLDVNPRAKVRSLPMAQREQVELAKVLVAGAEVLVLVEPTSVLAPQEVDGLFSWQSAPTPSPKGRGGRLSPCSLASQEERDAIINSGMESGMQAGWDLVEQIAISLV